MKTIKAFIKKETVLSIAMILSVGSMFLVTPSKKYIDYINFRVLAILLGLMIVMEGLSRLEVFHKIAQSLILKVKTTRQLSVILIFLCFFFSMIITNDVALITFVPLALAALRMADAENLVIPVVVLQTIAANLGSMLTPIGNPQNLYLYDKMNISIGAFILFMLPLTGASAILILLMTVVITKGKKELVQTKSNEDEGESVIESTKKNPKKVMLIGLYLLLFMVNLLVVTNQISYLYALSLTVFSVFIMDRKTLKKVDYSLILTFIAFFVFVGNMGSVESIALFLKTHLEGRELLLGTLSSQVISNVPASLLLAGFTKRYDALVYGVNIGGLGTLIASMASLISYKYVAREYQEKKGKYILYFTIVSLGMLPFLLGLGLLLI